jgi:hypothetical protein
MNMMLTGTEIQPGGKRMNFLTGDNLTAEMRRLAKGELALRIAVAYWGADSLSFLQLESKRSDVEIVCCLKGGKSDPDEIKKFENRARQNDNLHANVIWSSEGAIVGSANASSNGTPEEEATAGGLIEAGIFVEDPVVLDAIRTWFDTLWATSLSIEGSSLEAARTARNNRIWSESKQYKGGKRTLIEALRSSGKLEFLEQRIYFAFYRDQVSGIEREEVNNYKITNIKSIGKQLKLKTKTVKELDKMTDYYLNWPTPPPDSYLIDFYLGGRTPKYQGVFKTFHQTSRSVTDDGTNITFVLRQRYNGFPYEISARDIAVISKSALELWKKAKGGSDGRILSLLHAAPVLLSSI